MQYALPEVFQSIQTLNVNKMTNWKEHFDNKFAVDYGNSCDLCGHDHTESGDNNGYGDELKSFISQTLEKLIDDMPDDNCFHTCTMEEVES
jgi:hypothetical protein